MRDKVLPARTGAGTNAKKFAQRTINAPKMAFYGLLGELFRESTGGGVVLGELFRGSAREVGCWANFFVKTLVEGLCWANFFAGQPAKSGAGRTFSRNSGRRRCAGRVLYRVGRRSGRLGEFCLAESQMWLAQGLSHAHRRPAHRRRRHALPLHVCPVVMPNRPVGTASRIRPLCVHRPTQTARPCIMRGRAATQASAGISTQRERPNGT